MIVNHTFLPSNSDPYRLQFHLMPPVGWLNDPNGLCQYQGVYHVFFQYSPSNPEGGEKVWGHYISKNLIDWEFIGIPLEPDTKEDQDGVYSGCAFEESQTMYLFYTGNVKEAGVHDYIYSGRQANTIMVNSKDGIHFSEKKCLMTNADYPDHFTCHIRDPKVWKEKQTYYMIQGGRIDNRNQSDLADQGAVILFQSKDLLHWSVLRVLSTDAPFGYMWECPDYFHLNGNSILSLSPQGLPAEKFCYQNIYQSGYFTVNGDLEDSTSQITLSDFKEWDMGFDFYAPQTFEDQLGRRILIGWAGIPDADYDNEPTVLRGWQHALTVPRELFFEKGTVYQRPVKELEQLRNHPIALTSQQTLSLETFRTFELNITECSNQPFFFSLLEANSQSGLTLSYEQGVFQMNFVGEKASSIGRGRTTRNIQIEALTSIQILVDTSLIEVYLNHGEFVMTSRFYFSEPILQLYTQTNGDISLWNLNSALESADK